MANSAPDDLECMAEYYDKRILVELKKTLATLKEIVVAVEGGQSYTYRQHLDFKSMVAGVKDAIHGRDRFGAHSKTGCDRFRQIAYPEQFPAPETQENIVPV